MGDGRGSGSWPVAYFIINGADHGQWRITSLVVLIYLFLLQCCELAAVCSLLCVYVCKINLHVIIFICGLSALYGPVILHMLLVSVHCRA